MLQSKTIRFKRICDFGGYFAKSGPIKCDKGFKVRFDLRTPWPGRNDWFDAWIYLIDSQVPFDDYYKMQDPVRNKEDPSVHCYGVYPSRPNLLNLKQEWAEAKIETEYGRMVSGLPSSSPITMEYDRHKQTVRFTSSHFSFYQTGLPKDVPFAVGVWIYYKS